MRGIATPSSPAAVAEAVGAIAGRTPGSDAERRAAKLIAGELRRRDRRPRQQTVWVRTPRPLATALVAALGVLASVVSVDAAEAAAGIAGAALVLHLLRALEWLWAKRATELVSAEAAPGSAIELVLVAGVAAPRPALRDRIPTPALLVALALLGVLAAALVRTGDVEGTWLGALQLVPTVVLILAVGWELDAAVASPRRGSAGAADVEALLLVVDALAERPPRRLRVTIVAAGPEAFATWVRERKRSGTRPEEVAVLALGPAVAGRPRWWRREGRLWRPAYHPALVAHARAVAATRATSSSTASAARVARAAGWPALRVGGDAEPAAKLALGVVRRLDDELAQ